jgi:cAMP-specific phosphodiesterase 4
MGLFIFELVALSLVDAQYVLSFFQLMDVIGTLSMIFDISYMLGPDAQKPDSQGSTSVEEDALGGGELLRAARAAKIGARAGRLSRVLRILRFLPFLSQTDNRPGIASLISSQLCNLLASRVACLTIVLVMIIPLFDIWTFPRNDYSMQTWVQRLSGAVAAGDLDLAVTELNLMTEFYARYSYGPYMACSGIGTGDEFVCGATDKRLKDEWTPKLSSPPRPASAKWVYTGTFMVGFNMHAPNQLESGLAMCTICFIVFVMVFSGLALSSVVMQLAVRPLERMLDTVRQIATTVFKFSAQTMEDEDEHEEMADIDSSNEMKLLEKVVAKLAIIADLQTEKALPTANADNTDEDIGIFNMIHGKDVMEEGRKQATARQSMAAPRKKASILPMRMEDFGVSKDMQDSSKFNALPLTKAQRSALAVYTIAHFHNGSDGEGFCTSAEDEKMVQRFMTAVEKEYMPVPYHSFAHAVDVVHGTAGMMRLISSDFFLQEIMQYSLLVAAVAHDLGHPGVNNGFLSEVGHELALQYNDRSPLENMHCAKLYTIVANPSTNVFSGLTKEQYKEVRKYCIDTILHTDMMKHQAMVNSLQMAYQMNTEVFSKSPDEPMARELEYEVFNQPATRGLVMECILHSADVSNPARSFDVSHAWAMACLEEFFAQGDEEKRLGIPVQFLNDRDKLNKPNSQLGFIEFMIAPFFVAQCKLWPSMHEYGTNIVANFSRWAEIWEAETNPTEEERAKVRGRVERMGNNMQDAMTRGGILPPIAVTAVQ